MTSVYFWPTVSLSLNHTRNVKYFHGKTTNNAKKFSCALYNKYFPKLCMTRASGVAKGGLGVILPNFCQDSARYFLKIYEKIGVGRG